MQLHRLSGRKVCERVLRKGLQWKGRTFQARYVVAPPPTAQGKEGIFVGTVASTTLSKKAVERNRMRRRCREALRIALQNVQNVPTAQLLLLPRSPSLTCAFHDIQKDVGLFLLHLHHARANKAPF